MLVIIIFSENYAFNLYKQFLVSFIFTDVLPIICRFSINEEISTFKYNRRNHSKAHFRAANLVQGKLKDGRMDVGREDGEKPQQKFRA